MRSKFLTYILLMTIFLVSCSGTNKIEIKEKSIVGEWVIQDAKFKGTLDDMNLPEKMNLYTFFGSTIWLKAEGKSFEFRSDGSWSSNMVPEEVIDKVDLKYEFDKNIMMSTFMILDSTNFEFEVIVDELESNSMVWKFGNYMDVRLERKQQQQQQQQ